MNAMLKLGELVFCSYRNMGCMPVPIQEATDSCTALTGAVSQVLGYPGGVLGGCSGLVGIVEGVGGWV